MKKLLPLLMLLLMAFSSEILSQNYPLVTIEDIQYQHPDSLLANGDQPSPLLGDTVVFRGVIMVSPLVDPQTDRRRIIAAGARWTAYVQDHEGFVYDRYDGIFILQDDTSEIYQGTFFDLVDTAQVVEFTGVVSEYFTTTEFFLLIDPVTPVSIIEQLPKRPDPIELSVSDFDDNGTLNILAE